MGEAHEMDGDDREPLNQSSDVPTLEVMRGRVIAGLALGVAGVLLGILGAALSAAALTITAAVCAIVGCLVMAGTALLPLLSKPQNEEDQLSNRIDAVTIPPAQFDAAAAAIDTPAEESVIDPVTELPDGRYFEVAVEGRVAAARRHLWPVSIVLLQLGFDELNNNADARNRSLVSFANLMRQTLREADIACRIDENTFGLILEDTSEEGGVWTAERLQIALSHDTTNIRRLVAGVAAYPTHGLFSKDVMMRAQSALGRASSTPAGHGFGQVEVAHVDLS